MGAICEACIDQPPHPRSDRTHEKHPLVKSKSLDVPPPSPATPPPQPKIDFNQKRFIGRSQYGLVIVVTLRNDPTSTLYAMKILMKDKLPPINTAVALNQQTPHSDFLVNIIQIAEEEKRINILMEYMESRDLNYYRKKAGIFQEDTIRGTAAEVLIALEFLHSENIIYKFLKPENIMLTNQGHIKLTDYVLSKIIDSSRRVIDAPESLPDTPEPASAASMKSSSKLNILTLPGSVEYMAPCMFKPDKGMLVADLDFTTAVDIWTFGILLYELKNGHTPFGGSSPASIREQIEKGKYSFSGDCSAELKDIISIILVKDATARPTISQLKQHPFFGGVNWEDVKHRRNPPPLAGFREQYNIKFEEPSKDSTRLCLKESMEDSTKGTFPQSSLTAEDYRNK